MSLFTLIGMLSFFYKANQVFAETTSAQPETFTVRVENDQTLSIDIHDSEEFQSVASTLTAYFLPESCVTDLTASSLAIAVSENSPCADTFVSVGVTQAGQYSFNPSEKGFIILAHCNADNFDCISHPDRFVLESISKIELKKLPNDNQEVLSATQTQ